jgi:hypothetical protein
METPKFKKSVSGEIEELDDLMIEIAEDIRKLDALLRPKLAEQRAAEEAIAATVRRGIRLADRELRKPYFDQIAQIRFTHGHRFEALKDLKRRMKAAQKHRAHLAKLRKNEK